MKFRRLHNNKGRQQLKRDRPAEQVKRMARRLGVPFGLAQCGTCGGPRKRLVSRCGICGDRGL
jgi:hypothetical protein